MGHKPGIDRRKQEIDVLEQVMRGVRTQAPEDPRAPHVVDISIRGWAVGTVKSAIHVQILDDDADER
jgi:hypothetical protein